MGRAPDATVWGGGARVAFRSRRRARIARARAGAYRSAPAAWEPDTPWRPRPVQNPYVRLRFGQIDLTGLQGAGASSGYPCSTQPMIAACRCLPVACRGIGSSGICLELSDAVGQDGAGGLDALGAVQRQQGLQAAGDLLGGQSVCDQLVNFQVA